MTSKKTIVIGASNNRSRYSYIATERLLEFGHEVVPIGIRNAKIHGLQILPYGTKVDHVHTITFYLNPRNQHHYYDYFLGLKPVRFIFNPGAENEELAQLAYDANIEVVDHCTLVMLDEGQY